MVWLDMALDQMEAEVEEAVQRHRTPVKAIVSWLVGHMAGLSLREVSASEFEGLKRSHNAVWKWIQKFSPELFEADRGRCPETVVLDETSTNIGGEDVYLHAAINPESRRILLVRLYPSRSILSVWLFMKEFIKRYGRPRLVCTDGGPWYHHALKVLRLKHQIISGGYRNYIERWFLTLKHRVWRFDKHFPCRCGHGAHTHIQNWFNLYIYYYNNIRIHRTLKMPPALFEKGLS